MLPELPPHQLNHLHLVAYGNDTFFLLLLLYTLFHARFHEYSDHLSVLERR